MYKRQVLGQSTSFIVACACHFKLNTEIENQVAYLKPDRIIIHEIFSVGIPAGMIQALSAVLLLGMNKILAQLSVYAEMCIRDRYQGRNWRALDPHGVSEFLIFLAGCSESCGINGAIIPMDCGMALNTYRFM